MRRLRSFRLTSAALVIRLEVIPCAIEDIVWIEQGDITIPSVRKDPLASGAEMSSIGHEKSASNFKSEAFLPVSKKRVFSPERLNTK